MRKILVTGGAGFIGSNLVESLLETGYKVVCLDNLSTGSEANVQEFLGVKNFEFVTGDILDFKLLVRVTQGCYAVSHQAALGSVPRSINDPITSNRVNVEGTLNVFKAAVENKVPKVVFAASSSTYGDSTDLPKKENIIGQPLSPYAVTKLVNELYASVFYKTYGLHTIGLRYFNVFGPKQNPQGPYAAVIPLFLSAILEDKRPIINGDGSTSRDFTFVKNAVQANIKAIETSLENYNETYNIALGKQTSLVALVNKISKLAGKEITPIFADERVGDVKHSLADISKARNKLSYAPTFDVDQGLKITMEWYKQNTT